VTNGAGRPSGFAPRRGYSAGALGDSSRGGHPKDSGGLGPVTVARGEQAAGPVTELEHP